MAYKYAVALLVPLLISGCTSHASSGYDGHRTHSSAEVDETYIRAPYPDPYYNKEYMSQDQRRAISEQLRANRLEARGRRDNSTDSGDGFGQPVPRGF
ncbi:hypothetical protein MUA02_01505 [Enterobacteriaceae bacterium H20N1]|uniref:Lipoprotein n=1 Tax=Dryocola boscaweniae TaxID=2925397 RepID=A0A9X2W487_9ENTR|nr:hypothetical protein [Dryocola boscaweniae]MCT4700661.1 hypothetical protein [Dryocola boscaweniae]MCT4713948.1 hypothetical protein [Dryocola boscaweniae]MCT4717735.1 hypothetical protein [Dryocola boscaweniae]